MRGREDLYAILQVDFDASREEIKASYSRLLDAYSHSPDQQTKIRQAWAIMGDAARREEYDKSLGIALRKRRRKRNRPSAPRRATVAKTQVFDLASGDEPKHSPPGEATEVIRLTPEPELSDSPMTSLPIREPEAVAQTAKTMILPRGSGHPGIPGYGGDTETRIHPRLEHQEIPHSAVEDETARAWLEVHFPDGTRQDFPLGPGRTRIGRKRDNDIVLPDSLMHVSRYHAVIIAEQGGFCLVDNDSLNGTRINGRLARSQQKILLREGDTIEIEDRKLIFRRARRTDD